MDEPRFIDPNRTPVVLTNGPVTVASVGELVMITFTQVTPRIEGQPIGKAAALEYDFGVVARVAIPQSRIHELPKLLQANAIGNAPVAGTA